MLPSTARYHILLRHAYTSLTADRSLALLEHNGLKLSNLSNVNIFIADMADFGRINAMYMTFFGSSPPARACVAVDLPSPHRVKLDCIAYTENTSADRQALHVQGLSYWAPANIGPYSQAIVVSRFSMFEFLT